MKTAKQREQEFRDDLKSLLEKHNAELDITDDRRPYGMQSGICTISIDGIYDKDGETVAEYTEFNL